MRNDDSGNESDTSASDVSDAESTATARHPDHDASSSTSGTGTDGAVDEQGYESPSEDSDDGDVETFFPEFDPGLSLRVPVAPTTQASTPHHGDEEDSEAWRARDAEQPQQAETPPQDPSPPQDPHDDELVFSQYITVPDDDD